MVPGAPGQRTLRGSRGPRSADSQRTVSGAQRSSADFLADSSRVFFRFFGSVADTRGGFVGFVAFGHKFDEIQPEIQISADLFQIDSIRHSSLQQLISHV